MQFVRVASVIKKDKVLWLCLLFCLFSEASAQDPQFSQFYASPLHLNPALTGGFAAKYRVSAIYRDQWRGPLEESIAVFGAAIDLRFDMNSRALEGDAAAAGLYFTSDQVGPFDLSTNTIALSGAYHKALDLNNSKYLSAGVQLATTQRNLLYENLVFQDQFDGVDQFNGVTTEDLPENNFSFGDFAFGINYVSTPSSGISLYLGATAHHLLEPQVSFYSNDQDEQQQILASSKLFRRYGFHGGIATDISENTRIAPRVFFTNQGPHTSVSIGNTFIIEPSRTDVFNMHLGAWIKLAQDFDDAISPDVLGFLAGFGVGDLLIGLSYDLNLRDVVNYQTGQGAFELSISYFGNYEDEGGACPTF